MHVVSTHAIIGADPHWIDYVAAFGTLLASIVAVGIALWARSRDDRQRPELSLVYDGGKGDDFLAGVHENQREEHRVRMRVANKWGKRSAEDVEVILVRLQRPSFKSMVDGYSFAWSNTHDRDGRPLTRLTVPPGLARSFDFLSLTEPRSAVGGRSKSGADFAALGLSLEPPEPSGTADLQAGEHTILVALTAKDTDTVYYSVKVSFDGKWWGADAIHSHLKVTQPRVAGYMQLDPREGLDRMLRANWSRRDRLALRLRSLNPIGRRRSRRAMREGRYWGGPNDPHREEREAAMAEAVELEAREDAKGDV